MIKTLVKKGVYFDSVKLMLVTKKIKAMPEIIEAGIVMGTDLNKDILDRVNLLSDEARSCSPADLIISINGQSQQSIELVLEQLDDLLNARAANTESTEYNVKSLDGALNQQPKSNLAIISIPGSYAAIEAQKALQQGLHVMMFSDNVSIDDEKQLKEYANEHGLLMMGPDCGTSIINDTPLCFANKIRRGAIGIVGASGTGIQEVSTLIHQQGYGISHAIGTGGRDLSLEIGGITMIQALKALNQDIKTKVIVVISKPPAHAIAEKILQLIKTEIKKPVVINFLGEQTIMEDSNTLVYANNLEQAALKAIYLLTGEKKAELISPEQLNQIVVQQAAKIANNKRYIRGLYCGGTLNYETILILEKLIGDIYSNTPVNKDCYLKDPYSLLYNSTLDLGDDAFTVGRAHPMIDPSLRDQIFEQQLISNESSILLFDVVLGYGAHAKPIDGILTTLEKYQDKLTHKVVITSICGTDQDPQHYMQIKTALEHYGVIVAPSNFCAATIAGEIYNYKNKA